MVSADAVMIFSMLSVMTLQSHLSRWCCGPRQRLQ